MRRAAAGDREATEELLLPYEKPLLRLARRMLGPDRAGDVADLAQEIFLRIITNLERVDPERPFKPYFYRVASNLIIDHLRREVRRGIFYSGSPESRPASGERPPHGGREEMVDLERAITRLPLHYQTVLVLSFAEGLKYREISEVLEIPINTVKTYLHRARRALRELLEVEP